MCILDEVWAFASFRYSSTGHLLFHAAMSQRLKKRRLVWGIPPHAFACDATVDRKWVWLGWVGYERSRAHAVVYDGTVIRCVGRWGI